jgi:hypothetical protein
MSKWIINHFYQVVNVAKKTKLTNIRHVTIRLSTS